MEYAAEFILFFNLSPPLNANFKDGHAYMGVIAIGTFLL